MVYFKKPLGQNFLTSHRYARKLVKAAQISATDTVLEVGAGAGMLTQHLLTAKKVVAVEIDKRFVSLLQDRFKQESNLKIVNQDILDFDTAQHGLAAGKYKLVGSLPYNIGKRIIRYFLEQSNYPSGITVIIQKEVAENYTAEIPRAAFLANYIRIFGTAEMISTISRKFFKPKPQVDGAILHISIAKADIKNSEKFIKFLKLGFATPRKKLINNLLSFCDGDKESLKSIFFKIQIDPNARASNLAFETWCKLYDALH